jgi:hypothetical protein
MSTLIRLNDLAVNNAQGTIFAPTQRFIPVRFLPQLLEKFASQFDETPVVLPIPDDAPPEIPRVILMSKDKQWQCEVASIRVNYRWVQMSESQQMKLADFCASLGRFFQTFLAIEQARVGRMAFLTGRYYPMERPGGLLARQFCRDALLQNALNDPENFEMHCHTRIRVATRFDANSWIRFKTGQVNLPGSPSKSIILVEQDVNTLAEGMELHDYAFADIDEFFGEALNEIERRLRVFVEA